MRRSLEKTSSKLLDALSKESCLFCEEMHLTYALDGQYAKPLPTISRTTKRNYPFLAK